MIAGKSVALAAGLIASTFSPGWAAPRLEGWIGVEPRRWPPSAPPAPAVTVDCVGALAGAGLDAVAATPPAVSPPACAIETPVRLRAVATGQGVVRIAGEPLVACGFAIRFGAFVREIAAPLAKGGVGRTLVAIEAGGGYECRPRNRVAGAKISAHGRGVALDVAAFRFADGARLAVGAREAGAATFLAGLRAGACGYFTTVLGPGADAAHGDHLHLDLEPHGASGIARICQ